MNNPINNQNVLPLYVFIDESGDFNFSKNGTRHYTITAVITHCPWEFTEAITESRLEILSGLILPNLKQEYLEDKLCNYFHATEDKQCVRDLFFDIICQMKCIKIHSIVIRKYRANPTIQDPNHFYSMMVGKLIDYIYKRYKFSRLCIFIDGTPVSKQKKAFIKSIKSEINSKQDLRHYRIYNPKSASQLMLQVSDYVNWGIYRKWENGDDRSYNLIKHLLGTPEFDIFKNGDFDYY